MSCLTLERARELISSFNGPFIIAMHKRGDNLIGYFTDVLKYIKSDEDKKYNIIELDVSNMPELCAEHRIITPCTVLFLNGRKRYMFGEFATISYIEAMVDMMINNKNSDSMSDWWYGDDDEDDDEEEEIG